MGARAAVHLVRRWRIGGTTRLRVDLHGVSVFGPRGRHVLVRWEWVQEIIAGDGVTVRSSGAAVVFPAGSFGLSAEDLADQLRAACAIERRADVIEALARGG